MCWLLALGTEGGSLGFAQHCGSPPEHSAVASDVLQCSAVARDALDLVLRRLTRATPLAPPPSHLWEGCCAHHGAGGKVRPTPFLDLSSSTGPGNRPGFGRHHNEVALLPLPHRLWVWSSLPFGCGEGPHLMRCRTPIVVREPRGHRL